MALYSQNSLQARQPSQRVSSTTGMGTVMTSSSISPGQKEMEIGLLHIAIQQLQRLRIGLRKVDSEGGFSGSTLA